MPTTTEFHNHPELVANWETYTALDAFTSGAPERVSSYLEKHASEADGTIEGERNYATRLKRLYNVNFCDPYLFLHWCHMSQPITLSGMDGKPLDAIKSDATGYGEDFIQVARDRLWYYDRDGRVGTLVDGPAVIADNKEQAVTTKERSYQVIYQAKQIRYWERFTDGPRKGQLRELVLEMPGKKGKACFRRFVQPEGNVAFQFEDLEVASSTSGIALINNAPVQAEVVATGTGGLNTIPFVVMGCGPEDSFIKDVWPLNKTFMNLLSVLSNVLYNQGFQHSVLTGARKEEITKITEYTITLLSNPDASIHLIPPGDPQGLFSELANLKGEIHRRAKFQYNQLADDTRQVQSAESKEKDLIVQKVIYDNTLDLLSRTEEKIYRFHAEFEGANPDDISVSIARDYGLEDKQAKSAQQQQVFSMAGQLGVQELQKEILKIWASELDYIPSEEETEDDVRQRMFEAIDAADSTASTAAKQFASQGLNLFGDN